jgi:hypothetical protein
MAVAAPMPREPPVIKAMGFTVAPAGWDSG